MLLLDLSRRRRPPRVRGSAPGAPAAATTTAADSSSASAANAESGRRLLRPWIGDMVTARCCGRRAQELGSRIECFSNESIDFHKARLGLLTFLLDVTCATQDEMVAACAHFAHSLIDCDGSAAAGNLERGIIGPAAESTVALRVRVRVGRETPGAVGTVRREDLSRENADNGPPWCTFALGRRAKKLPEAPSAATCHAASRRDRAAVTCGRHR